MATGRVPIPVDRTADLADRLDLDPKAFLAAVLVQRHPDIDFAILAASGPPEGETLLELTGGRHLDELTAEQRRVVREVVSDAQASRRWLTPHEVSAVEKLRERRPYIATDGLSRGDMEAIQEALPPLRGNTDDR